MEDNIVIKARQSDDYLIQTRSEDDSMWKLCVQCLW